MMNVSRNRFLHFLAVQRIGMKNVALYRGMGGFGVKRIFSLFLIMCMVVTFIPTIAMAGEKSETISGTLTYNPGMNQTKTVDFVYSDSLFSDSGYQYTQDLAEQSMYLTLASYTIANLPSPADSSNNLRQYLTDCGYQDFEANDGFTHETQPDSFGVGIAHRSAIINGEPVTIIAMGLRGGEYGAEWAGNVNVGTSGDHTGFAICGDESLRFLKDYLHRHSEIQGKIKIWASGFSRGAAGANMFGGRLDDLISSGDALSESTSLSLNDVYIYCYETPMGADASKVNSKIYNNIHNIINRNDVVPLVAPECMGFSRYGVDHYLPCKDIDENYDALYQASISEAKNLSGALGMVQSAILDNYSYISVSPEGSSYTNSSMSSSEFLRAAVPAFCDSLGYREGFVQNLQPDLQELLVTFDRMGSHLPQVLSNLISKAGENVNELINSAQDPSSGDALFVQIEDMLLSAMRDAGVSTYDASQVNAMVEKTASLIGTLVADHPNELATLLVNFPGYIATHDASYVLAWMRTLPDDFMVTQQSTPSSNDLPFTDVPYNFWGKEYIQYALNHDLMVGTSATTFAPYENVTRGQIMTVLYGMKGAPSASGFHDPFSDVEGTWCRDAIVWGYHSGLIGGYEDGRFGFNDPVTREQLAAILYRYAAVFYGSTSATGNIPSRYIDGAMVSEYAVPGIMWCIDHTIMNGNDIGELMPQAPCTRAEFAVMITRLHKTLQ